MPCNSLPCRLAGHLHRTCNTFLIPYGSSINSSSPSCFVRPVVSDFFFTFHLFYVPKRLTVRFRFERSGSPYLLLQHLASEGCCVYQVRHNFYDASSPFNLPMVPCIKSTLMTHDPSTNTCARTVLWPITWCTSSVRSVRLFMSSTCHVLSCT